MSGRAQAAEPSAQASSVSGVVGTWRMYFSSGPGRGESQYPVVIFPGGIFLGFDSPIESVGPLNGTPRSLEYAGPNAGQWLQMPNGDVRVTLLQLNYDDRVVVTSEEWSQYTLTYNAANDTLSGTREWRLQAPDGRVIATNVGTMQATRIGVDV
jgi:hypothetical protein